MHTADDQLDIRGYNCPIPLLRAKKALAAMRDGQVLKVLTTDAGAEIDFRVFADASGHRLLALEWVENVLTILIERRSSNQISAPRGSEKPVMPGTAPVGTSRR